MRFPNQVNFTKAHILRSYPERMRASHASCPDFRLQSGRGETIPERGHMTSWRILLTDGLEENGQALLRQSASVDDRCGITPEQLLEAVKDCDALIAGSRTRLTPAVFAAAQRLKVVGVAGTGVDNIDLPAAHQRGVVVVNAPTAATAAVAELTLAFILVLARQITAADAAMKTGQWTKKTLQGCEVSGRTLGILGMGNAGSAVARGAAALGMRPVGYDPLLDREIVQRRGAEPLELAELYAISDFISLHLPLTPETRGMIDGQSLAHMKRGVYLICTARGGIINETALLGALESGQVAGAALDVYQSEPPGLNALVSHPQVIATPHIGAQTIEAQRRAAQDIAEEVLAALHGAPLRWRVL
jgi:D-3-phosphoglycerate dehydrogenase